MKNVREVKVLKLIIKHDIITLRVKMYGFVLMKKMTVGHYSGFISTVVRCFI